MKFSPADKRRGVTPARVVLTLLTCGVIPLLTYAAAPAWWSQRGVLVANPTPDDYAPANQGQLKNIAAAAVAEMDAKLPGGAGEALRALVTSWSASAHTNDFAPVNIGQLKNLAELFYDRLAAAGLASDYPWPIAPQSVDDFAVANVGQVKALFAFDFTNDAVPSDLADRLATSAAAGTLALDRRGAVWIWGELSDDWSTVLQRFPVRFDSVSDVTSVTAGSRHGAVLRRDGTVFTWGKNYWGQLGDGTTTDRSLPAAVPGLGNTISVKAGEGGYTLALQADGTVYAWGDNYYGSLGVADIANSTVPVMVSGLTDVHSIAAGSGHSFAIKNDGTLWSWGYIRDDWGQEIWSATPAQVEGLQPIIDVAAGYEHVLAVQDDGTVWSWGSNWQHALGTSVPRGGFQSTPLQVPGLSNVIKVAAASNHSFALLEDGTIWAWGENQQGQLGDGTTIERPAPIQITGISDVVAIAASGNYTMAMKRDGTVWAWGYSARGRLDGVDPLVPHQITLGLLDTNRNGIDDRWELEHFGNLDQTAGGDFDGDGISNLQEVRQGTNPTDYFNGATPVVEIVDGNNQVGDPGTFTALPLTVRVRSASGASYTNAPVTFSVSSGSGALALNKSEAGQQPPLIVRTGLSGEASVYYKYSSIPGESSRITASSGNVPNQGVATLREVGRYLPLPTPTATPPPDGEPPPPTPSLTATPVAPYRYAIIDLGKDTSPIRVNNKGWALIAGTDADGTWSHYRWKGGVRERLSYPATATNIWISDMNDEGIVIGTAVWDTEHVDNAENETAAGLVWPVDTAIARKVSAPTAAPMSWTLRTGSLRQAWFNTITNKNEVFGGVLTEESPPSWFWRYGWYGSHGVGLNAHRWDASLTSATPLSHFTATAIGDPVPFFWEYTWQGALDTVTRANSNRQFIGRRQVPAENPGHFFSYWLDTHIVDGLEVPFQPIDLNEAGIVVGAGSENTSMIIRAPGGNDQTTINGLYPISINDHVRHRAADNVQFANAGEAALPVPAPQILSWAGNATVLWEWQEEGRVWHPFGLEEMIPNMEGWEISAIADMNDDGVIVGTGSYKDPSDPGAQTEQHGFMLVPVALLVDGNRDGEMSFSDPSSQGADQTTQEKPYRFWVNDDQDALSGTNTSGEVVPAQIQDRQDNRIQSVRDCEDLARLSLSLKGQTEAFINGNLRIALRFRNVRAGNPAIRIFRSVANGGRKYLTSDAWAAAQIEPQFNQSLSGSNGSTVVSSSGSVPVDRQFWSALDETNPVIDLLFEGVEEGKGELYAELVQDGRKIGEAPGVWLHVINVKKMYQRAKGTPNGGIEPPYQSQTTQPAPQSTWFEKDDNGHQFDQPVDEADSLVVFVHGIHAPGAGADGAYNTNIAAAETVFKRLWHQGFRGRFAFYKWPALNPAGGIGEAGFNFNLSEYRALKYGRGLSGFVQSIPKSSKNLYAHSQGNVVAGAALANYGLRVDSYVLTQAAVPAGCYDVSGGAGARDSVNGYERFWAKEATMPTPDYRDDLGYRGFLRELNAAANVVNFYNAGDFALATGRLPIADCETMCDTNWEANQISYKPDGPFSGSEYRYAPSLTQGQRCELVSLVNGDKRIVADLDESMAFVARPRSKAVGAKAAVRGSINEEFDLAAMQDAAGRRVFTESSADHSAQIVRGIHDVWPYYRQLALALGILPPTE